MPTEDRLIDNASERDGEPFASDGRAIPEPDATRWLVRWLECPVCNRTTVDAALTGAAEAPRLRGYSASCACHRSVLVNTQGYRDEVERRAVAEWRHHEAQRRYDGDDYMEKTA